MTNLGKRKYGTSETAKNIMNKKNAIKKRKDDYFVKDLGRVDDIFDKTYNRDSKQLQKYGMSRRRAENQAIKNAIGISNALDSKVTAKYKQDMKSLKKDYKDAKKDRNTKINTTTKDVMKKSKIGEKLLYNKATFRKAAQYMVDNDISSNEAKRIAKTEARRNTIAALALIGGGYLYAKKKL